MRETWSTNCRQDVTLSLPDPDEAMRAVLSVREALDAAGYGYRVSEALGAWRGTYERSYTVSLVGSIDCSAHAARIAIRAAHAAGCEAVQLETFHERYRCVEVRP